MIMNHENNDNNKIILHDITDREHILEKEISRGGQGAVFRTNDNNIAVKLVLENDDFLTLPKYSKQEIDRQNKQFRRLILLPIPSRTNITLPLVTFTDAVGYTMKLMEDMDSFENVFEKEGKKYTNPWFQQTFQEDDPMGRSFAGYVGSGGARKRLHAFYLCSCILARLHANGLVYCDFSDKNVFLTKKTYENNVEFNDYRERDDYIFTDYENDNVWLIDADNLNYQSVTIKSGYYTPNYGAPEVVASQGCTFYSDCYAFAVSLFWNLTLNHPFKGEAYENCGFDDFDEDADELLNNGKFSFVCDEQDDSNISGSPFIDMLLNDKIMNTFRRTFSERGKTEIRTRPSIMEWSQVIADSLDTTITCTECRMPFCESKFGSECPWCEHENTLVIIESYVSENMETGTHTGSFRREIRQEIPVNIPLRIMTGIRHSSPDEVAFRISVKNGIMTFSSFNPDYSFSVISTEKIIAGKYETNKESVDIHCRNIQREEHYYLRIGITK
ncbi:MAG: hypothetical protein K2K16_01890 [Ruminococcus sp.]|nr:hypothetical protein [Ruminococcus sp.]